MNLEGKLQHARRNLDKIVSTKVFAKGNQVVYELDQSSRQIRILKDNVFAMETNLSKRIKLDYETEINKLKRQI